MQLVIVAKFQYSVSHRQKHFTVKAASALFALAEGDISLSKLAEYRPESSGDDRNGKRPKCQSANLDDIAGVSKSPAIAELREKKYPSKYNVNGRVSSVKISSQRVSHVQKISRIIVTAPATIGDINRSGTSADRGPSKDGPSATDSRDSVCESLLMSLSKKSIVLTGDPLLNDQPSV